jgi:hypothetical protein
VKSLAVKNRAIILEQSGDMVRVVFQLESVEDADSMIEGLYHQMKQGHIDIILDEGKAQAVHDRRGKHLN